MGWLIVPSDVLRSASSLGGGGISEPVKPLMLPDQANQVPANNPSEQSPPQ